MQRILIKEIGRPIVHWYRRYLRPPVYGLFGVHDLSMKAVVISYPASGRTWFMVMANDLGIKVRYTHDGSEHRQKKHFEELHHDGSAYKDKKAILIIRDPRDVVVSGYFEATKRLPGASKECRFNGTIHEFVHDPRHGIEKIVQFYKTWHQIANDNDDVLVISYEAMKEDTVREINRMLGFLDITNISNERVNQTVESAKFENMKKKEANGAYASKYGGLLTPGDPNDPDSFKTRKGKVGGYVEYLGPEDTAYCESIMERLGCPWYGSRNHS